MEIYRILWGTRYTKEEGVLGLLCLLNQRFDLPWLYAGDFNEIVSSLEKMGGSSRSQVQMQLFREAIDECGFLDLGLSGSQFTWQKHFSNGHLIWERLDRCWLIMIG